MIRFSFCYDNQPGLALTGQENFAMLAIGAILGQFTLRGQ